MTRVLALVLTLAVALTATPALAQDTLEKIKSTGVLTIEIKEGVTTTLRPGSIQIRSTRTFKAAVEGADGQIAGEVSSGVHRIALPPGKYTLIHRNAKLTTDEARVLIAALEALGGSADDDHSGPGR